MGPAPPRLPPEPAAAHATPSLQAKPKRQRPARTAHVRLLQPPLGQPLCPGWPCPGPPPARGRAS
eukprot:2184545-Alexandrium_andersonii.AAC.1